MAGTFIDLQNRINLDYLNRTDLVAETKRAIVRAQKHYEKERFWFNMTATAIAVGTASTTVAIPADFLALDFVTMRDASQDFIVNIKSFDRLAYQLRSIPAGAAGASGVAQEICYWHDLFYFFPKPQSATTLTVHYTQSFASLNLDTDANGWTSAGEDVIVYHAVADLMGNVLRNQDPNAVVQFKQLEMEAYKMLVFGNSIRMGMEEQAVTGSVQSASPKTPDKGQPT